MYFNCELEHITQKIASLSTNRPFQYADISVQLHWRPTDYRARILYLTTNKQTGRPLRYCYPLTSLILRRYGACLKLGRLNDNDRLDLWASLRFDVYESKSFS